MARKGVKSLTRSKLTMKMRRSILHPMNPKHLLKTLAKLAMKSMLLWVFIDLENCLWRTQSSKKNDIQAYQTPYYSKGNSKRWSKQKRIPTRIIYKLLSPSQILWHRYGCREKYPLSHWSLQQNQNQNHQIEYHLGIMQSIK